MHHAETREFKFRGKNIETGEWVYGDLVRGQNETYIAPKQVLLVKTFVEVDPKTVGQYTGLIDRHDKEIYQDDIVQVYGVSPTGYIGRIRRFVVAWQLSIQKVGWSIGNGKPDLREVVGNIHDNLEMAAELREEAQRP